MFGLFVDFLYALFLIQKHNTRQVYKQVLRSRDVACTQCLERQSETTATATTTTSGGIVFASLFEITAPPNEIALSKASHFLSSSSWSPLLFHALMAKGTFCVRIVA